MAPVPQAYKELLSLKRSGAAYELPPLPYGYDSLEPYVDTLTMQLHHDKHHQAYTDKMNGALQTLVTSHSEHRLAKEDVYGILQHLNDVPTDIKKVLQNHGGGYVNHQLFWLIMSPKRGTQVPTGLHNLINESFGSFETFKDSFSATATNIFGSGWAWLALDDSKKLQIIGSPNQDNPLFDGQLPILGLDVWEHAYYIKYQNRRPEYIKNWWNTVDWDIVNKFYEAAVDKRG